MGCLLCARHYVNCMTCINLFDYSINCLLKEYTEGPPLRLFFSSTVLIPEEVGVKRSKIWYDWGKSIKFTELFIQETRD